VLAAVLEKATTACANNSMRDLQITPKLIVRARLSPFLSPFLRSEKEKNEKKRLTKRLGYLHLCMLARGLTLLVSAALTY
jgi:hypothetical protein